jgi:hypothetical protein
MVLGGEHPDTLDTIRTRAEIWFRQMRCNEAEEAESHVLKTQKKVWPEHPCKLFSMYFLSCIRRAQAWYPEAMGFMTMVARLLQKILGVAHR